MSETFSTKTIISFTNILINMENFFKFIPIRDICIERKNNRKKKIDNVFNIDDKQEVIPSGSIVCVKWRNQERGTIIKTASIVRNSNRKKNKRDKYFLNSITTIMYFNNDKYKDKLINLKITNTGRIQMTGCKEDELTITGKVESEDGDYVHKGIADRAFTRHFTLADSVVVKNAELVNGMLKIFLERFIPEEKKPKKINIMDPFGIGETTAQLLNEASKPWANAWNPNNQTKAD